MVPPHGRKVIRVHPALAGEIRKYGAFGEVCYSCGTCTLSCDLSTDGAPFPRRPVQYAVLGLKDPLLESLEPWLCHDCGDCSPKCPQQAGPRESMATLRRYLTGQYDWTGLSAKIQQSRAWAIGSLGGAALLVVLLMVLYHRWVVGMPLSDLTSESMGLAHMFPTITYFTLAVVFLPWVFLITNGVRMHRFTMGGGNGTGIPTTLYLSEIGTLLFHFVTQERMRKCPEKNHKGRHARHWMIAAGCSIILVLLVFVLRAFQTDAFHPVQGLGYLATAFLMIGTVDILIGRLEKKEEIFRNSEPEDYTFPVLLLLVTVSGIAVPILRYLGLPFAVHFTYLAHLAVSVSFLVIEVPFGKCSHMVYRPLAIYFQSVKDRAAGLETGKAGLEAA